MDTRKIFSEENFKEYELEDKVKLSGTEIYTDKADDSVVHVEVDGKSYQDGEPTPDYPVEIHSLNDFDVVSQKSEGGTIDGIEVGGRNYFARALINNIAEASGELRSGGNWKGYSFSVNEGEQYTIHRTDTTNNRWRLYWVYTDEVEGSTTHTTAFSDDSQDSNVPNTVKVPIDAKWGHLYLSNNDSDGSTIPNIMIEKGTKATDWTPAPEDITENDNHPLIDKINLSLSEPLRSVGDVKDRLFRDSDGLWKIERNVGKEIITSSGLSGLITANGYAQMYKSFRVAVPSSPVTSSKMRELTPEEWRSRTNWGIQIADSGNLAISLKGDWLTPVSGEGAFTKWVDDNQIDIQYVLREPIIETLDQELQDKLNNLRSFQDSNYIYTVNNTNGLEPNLHGVFKSKAWHYKNEIEPRFNKFVSTSRNKRKK